MKNIVALLFLVCLSACSYVGTPVTNMNADGVCRIYKFPASCSFSDNDFSINYTIEETVNPDEYLIEGTAKHIGGGTFTSYQSASFTLLIINDRVVVEELHLTGGSGSLETGFSFSKNFTTPYKVEATILGYHMKVRG